MERSPEAMIEDGPHPTVDRLIKRRDAVAAAVDKRLSGRRLAEEARRAGRTQVQHALRLGVPEEELAVETWKVPGRGALTGAAAEGFVAPESTVRLLEGPFHTNREMRRMARFRPGLFRTLYKPGGKQ